MNGHTCLSETLCRWQRRTYLSRWKLILKDYGALCARLVNSSQLLSGGDKAGSVCDQSDHSGKRPHLINLD